MNKFEKVYLKIIKEQTYEGDEPTEEVMAQYSDQYDRLAYTEQVIDDMIARNMRRSPSFKLSAQDWSEDFGTFGDDHVMNCAIYLDGCYANIYNNYILYFKDGTEDKDYKGLEEYLQYYNNSISQALKNGTITKQDIMKRVKRTGIESFVQKIQRKQPWINLRKPI